MRAKVVTCDKCGTSVSADDRQYRPPEPPIWHRLRMSQYHVDNWQRQANSHRLEVELCPECALALLKWLGFRKGKARWLSAQEHEEDLNAGKQEEGPEGPRGR